MDYRLPKTINKLIILSQTLSGIMLILIGTMYFLKMSKPEQEFFVNYASEEKQVIPLDEPNVSSKTLLRWASLAATNAYTLDFVGYEYSLNNLKPFFTKEGYLSFNQAIQSRLGKIVEKKLIVSAVVSSTPVLINEGKLNKIYTWKIQVPLLLTYQGASEKSTKQNIIVNMLVTRVPTAEAVTGIGINQLKDVAGDSL